MGRGQPGVLCFLVEIGGIHDGDGPTIDEKTETRERVDPQKGKGMVRRRGRYSPIGQSRGLSTT